MKNTFGNSLTLTLFGESHGEAIGATLDGIAPGVLVDKDYICHQLDLRRPVSSISTDRCEKDEFKLISGVKNGYTTGAPLTIIIENGDTNSSSYKRTIARPSHADYTANVKYHGFEDQNGGGHFSGRLTTPIVALGAIIKMALEKKGIYIGTHIKRIKDIEDRKIDDIVSDIKSLNDMYFAVLDSAKSEEMQKLIKSAKAEGDSVGGILETYVSGLECGVGEPWFDSLESVLSHGLFSIPAIKGVEFGDGFNIVNKFGSQANDEFETDGEKIYTTTNNSGGINGGISNGMPIVIRTAVKPTPTIFKEQKSVDFIKKENAVLKSSGRHDPCIVHRARVVQDSIVAFCIADMLSVRYGTDYLR